MTNSIQSQIPVFDSGVIELYPTETGQYVFRPHYNNLTPPDNTVIPQESIQNEAEQAAAADNPQEEKMEDCSPNDPTTNDAKTTGEYDNVLAFDLSTEGLEPLRHRIIGITCKSASEEKIFAERDEKELLTAFFNYIRANRFTKIIGFNSAEFDVPMLNIRSLKYGVPVVQIEPLHLDLRQAIFMSREHKKGTLKEFGALFGMKIEDHGYAKMHMSLFWERKDIHHLRECILEDVRITWALYEHAKKVQLL